MPEQEQGGIDVFISYAVQDKALADGVCALLEGQGYSCWIAPRDIPPGVTWPTAIRDAISRCRVMVLIFTQHANESRQMARELERADHHGVAVLPARFEKVEPAGDLEFFLGNRQWLDAFDGGLASHGEALLGSVERLMQTESGLAESSAAAGTRKKKARWGRRWVILLAAVMAGAGVYFGYRAYMSGAKPPAPMAIHASASQLSAAPDVPVRIVVRVVSKEGRGVPGALVGIKTQAAGGEAGQATTTREVFLESRLESRTDEVSGFTDGEGQFTANWVCRPCAAAYTLLIEASKAGYESATGGLRLTPAPVTKSLGVRATASPAVVAPKHATGISVRVFDGSEPVSGATVTISAGGGAFRGNGTEVTGETNSRGQYVAVWSCAACASAYEMTVRVKKRGYAPASARATVRVQR
ncbi:MAG: TIR domain-containing protein [Bryobacterales bacterium]|nr:TIR domain-containing protein [Bryobacterales bacterium]